MGLLDDWGDWWQRATSPAPAPRPRRSAPTGRVIRDPATGEEIGRVRPDGEIEIDIVGEPQAPQRGGAVNEGLFKWTTSAAAFAAAIYASGLARGWKGYAVGVGAGMVGLLVANVLQGAVFAPATGVGTTAQVGGDRREP